MNVEDIYNHRACERCHAQKLRCRPQTNEKCIRCTKANTKCVARPPRRGRRTEIAPERRSDSEEKIHLSASPEMSKHFHEVAGSEKPRSVYIRWRSDLH
jgi:PHP family Zn ribbon phosphoesterase